MDESTEQEIYHHRINRGGLDDILQNQRLVATDARMVAGGASGVRAHHGPYQEPAVLPEHDRGVTYIEFRTSRPPSQIHPISGVATWTMESERYLEVEVLRARRDGMTVEHPTSEREMEAAFRRQEAKNKIRGFQEVDRSKER